MCITVKQAGYFLGRNFFVHSYPGKNHEHSPTKVIIVCLRLHFEYTSVTVLWSITEIRRINKYVNKQQKKKKRKERNKDADYI